MPSLPPRVSVHRSLLTDIRVISAMSSLEIVTLPRNEASVEIPIFLRPQVVPIELETTSRKLSLDRISEQTNLADPRFVGAIANGPIVEVCNRLATVLIFKLSRQSPRYGRFIIAAPSREAIGPSETRPTGCLFQ